ncbi:unnamed protein product [Nezara viridula]|uniref:Uncharacterized protein n=1 Tax=Nezara viridula TaxID=85310 RepID=A0A9P0H8D7_NEZVI|nr:unnamed protein product [Nezara viridula]
MQKNSPLAVTEEIPTYDDLLESFDAAGLLVLYHHGRYQVSADEDLEISAYLSINEQSLKKEKTWRGLRAGPDTSFEEKKDSRVSEMRQKLKLRAGLHISKEDVGGRTPLPSIPLKEVLGRVEEEGNLERMACRFAHIQGGGWGGANPTPIDFAARMHAAEPRQKIHEYPECGKSYANQRINFKR